MPFGWEYDGGYVTPVSQIKKLVISSFNNTFKKSVVFPWVLLPNTYSVSIVKPDSTEQIIIQGNSNSTSSIFDESAEFDLTISGFYTLKYKVSASNSNGGIGEINCNLGITAVPNFDPLPKYTITDVVNRLLSVGVPRLQSVAPRFTFNAEQAEQFSTVEAPEFAFTGLTLKGALDQVGGYIHGIPRLKRGVLYFDMLGGTEVAELCDPKYPYLRQRWVTNFESYATELDSTVDNLVSILNPDEGVVTEPYSNGFKSVRSEEAYSRITDGNMVISTTQPIYTVQKLEVLAPNGVTADITGYLFEGSDYGRLSSFDGNYPTSKAFAIYYELGEKNIKGLSFKSPTVLGGATSNYAITNIIYAACGYDISSDWWDNGKESNYPKLLFRITYTPIFTSRIKHLKPYIKTGAPKRTLIYNQAANLVETRYYGENMKGEIARIGNPELVRIYRLDEDKIDLVPDIGQVWLQDGKEYYVSAVHYARLPTYYDIMLELSEDFNRLSQYIGINAEWRAYEVSATKAYNRDIPYSDVCVIGEPIQSDGLELYQNDALMSVFTQTRVKGLAAPTSVAVVTPYDEYGNAINTVSLPVISTAFGNTLVFTFGMEDNFSAGAMSVYGGTSDVSGYWQTDVKYTDYYGRVATLTFFLADHGKSVAFDSELGYQLPQSNAVDAGDLGFFVPIRTSDADRLVVDKNGGEILRMHYQIQFVTNRSDIIIGSAITHNSPLVSGLHDGHSAALYVMQKRIGKFDTKIDISAGTLLTDQLDITYSTSAHQATFNTVTSTVSGIAWVIVDKATGEILLASNRSVMSGQAVDLPTMTFTHEF